MQSLIKNINNCINFYNQQRIAIAEHRIDDIDRDPTKISWTRGLEVFLKKGLQIEFNSGCSAPSVYRPFLKENCYYSKLLNEMPGLWHFIYPIKAIQQRPNDNKINRIISVSGSGGKKDFACLMTNSIPCYDMIEKGQCFPLYVYDTEVNSIKQKKQRTLFNGGEAAEHSADSSNRTSGITDWILDYVNKKYNLVASSPSPIGRGVG